MSFEAHTVSVGSGGQHAFEPDTVYANPGDLITFKFYPTNHSVVRGEYTQSRSCGNSGCNPCVPYELFHPDEEGFQSGNIETQDGSGHDFTFNVTINDTSPIWFYCTALQSCSNNGMVGVINPAYGSSIEMQKQAAINAPFQLLPGDVWPAEGSATSSAAVPPSSTGTVDGPKAGISNGAIAGIVLAATLPIAAAVIILYRLAMSRAKRRLAVTDLREDFKAVPPMELQAQNPAPVASELTSPISPMSMPQTMNLSEKPPLSPPENHPAFGPSSQQLTTYELEGGGN